MPNTTTGFATAKQMIEPFSDKVQETVQGVQEKVQESVAASRRAYKTARAKTEDLIDDATHQIKRHPLQAAAITIGVGLGVGLAMGFLVTKALTPKRRFFGD